MEENSLAPLVIFVYDRLDHTKKLFNCLNNAKNIENTDVWIFSDGPKSKKVEKRVLETREYIKHLKDKNNFRNLYIEESNKNKGLANSVIEGVTKVLNLYGKVIVLEDDLIISETFLIYINKMLSS